MSVRAYRINQIVQESDESFNLWHDEKLVNFFEDYGLYETLSFGSGITELPVEALEEALKNAKKLGIKGTYIEKKLAKDIAWAKKHNEDYVQYQCY